MYRRRVLVVGDVATDVVVAVPVPLADGTGLAVGSDTWADISLSGGGSAANTATWLAHAGTPVTLVAAVGDDEAGRSRLAELAAAGVDTAVATLPGATTGAMVILTDPTERTMLADRGANRALPAAHVTAAVAAATDAGHLHLSAYPLFDPGSRPGALAALAAARAAGLTVSVDAASAGPLREAGAAAFAGWIGRIDLLIANLDEALVLLDDADCAEPDRIAHELTRLADSVVVKLGADGAVWTGPEGDYSVPAVPVGAVDSTGAGDAFAAGLLAALVAPGGDPATCLRAGAALGARAVSQVGARPR